MVEIGSITQPTTNTTSSITGLPAAPVAIWFWTSGLTADGGGDDCAMGEGWVANASGGIHQWSVFGISDDGAASTDGHTRVSNVRAITFINAAGTVVGEALVTAFNADGISITWNSADGTQRIVNYIALGGGDLVADCGMRTRPTSTGNQSETSLSFTGKIAFFNSASRYVTSIGTEGFVGGFSPGWAISSSARAAISWGEDGFRSAGHGCMSQRTVYCMMVTDPANGAIGAAADFVSFNADGFTVNWTTANAQAGYYGWAVLGGTDLTVDVGSFTTDTDTGSQVVSTAINPNLVILASWQAAASTSVTSGVRLSLGAAASSSQRAAAWCGGLYDTTDAQGNRHMDRDEAIVFATPPDGAGNATVVGEADFTAMGTGQFELNWGDASPGAYQVLFAVLAIDEGEEPTGQPTIRRFGLIGRGGPQVHIGHEGQQLMKARAA